MKYRIWGGGEVFFCWMGKEVSKEKAFFSVFCSEVSGMNSTKTCFLLVQDETYQRRDSSCVLAEGRFLCSSNSSDGARLHLTP